MLDIMISYLLTLYAYYILSIFKMTMLIGIYSYFVHYKNQY